MNHGCCHLEQQRPRASACRSLLTVYEFSHVIYKITSLWQHHKKTELKQSATLRRLEKKRQKPSVEQLRQRSERLMSKRRKRIRLKRPPISNKISNEPTCSGEKFSNLIPMPQAWVSLRLGLLFHIQYPRALVVQWIGCFPPKEAMQVRLLPRAPNEVRRSWSA
jgi:hypothetical protein